MQKIIKMAFIAVFVLMQTGLKAQLIKQVAVGFGTQGFEISLQKKLINHTSVVLTTALAKEGLTNQLNDPLMAAGLSYRFIDRKANSLELTGLGGLMKLNDPAVHIPVIFFRTHLCYNHFFGEKAHHGASISVGYNYGRRVYRQSNEDLFFRTELVSTFMMKPIYAQIAYIYRF